MDNNVSLNKTYETDCRSPLKELYIKNNIPEEKCENQNNDTHIFDMETTFLQNSVMIPAKLDSEEDGEFSESFNTNQENLTPRYSVLNSFDPIIRKESEEVTKKRQNNDLLSDDVLGHSVPENLEFLNAEFTNTAVEVFVEKTAEISVSVNDNLSSCISELNGTSASNTSAQSDNSVLNNTVILNKSLIVENKTPGQITVTDNSNGLLEVPQSTQSNNSTITDTDDGLNNEQTNVNQITSENNNESLNLSSSLKPNTSVINSSNELNLRPLDETFVTDNFNKISDSSCCGDSFVLEESSQTVSPNIESVPTSVNVNDSFINAFANKLVVSPEVDKSAENTSINETNFNECKPVEPENKGGITSNFEDKCESKLQLSIDSNEVALDVSVQSLKTVDDLNENQTNISLNTHSVDSDLTTVSLEQKVSAEINKHISSDISNNNLSVNETANESIKENNKECLKNNIDSYEIFNTCPQTTEPEIPKEINEKVTTEESHSELLNSTRETITVNSELEDNNKECLKNNTDSHEIINCPQTTETEIPKEINEKVTTEELHSELLNSTRETITVNSELEDNKCLKNNTDSYEIINCPQTTETEIPKEINEKVTTEKSHSELLNSTCETITVNSELEEVASSILVPEGTHMSSVEPNLGLNEPTVASKLETSATCTNEMGEIINQNECFEKQSDVENNAECEKYKMQVNELKQELKSCRQKTCTLETEIVDFKRKENELNTLLEEYKKSAPSPEELKRLQLNEETLKNEVKELRTLLSQQETHLKELQRKDIQEQEEQLKRLQINEEVLKNEVKELKALVKQQDTHTQSELQISRVMEEYEKSISSLISENEKMKKERDTAQMHLANIEMAFSDVHQKYERCKAIVQGYKDNEESFKQDIAMNRETIVIQEQKYETLKAHAMAQLEKSNQELAAMKKQHETEMARLTAQLKRYEIKNMSLMESLQQKAKECEQLSAVCDEFIGNV